MHFWQNVNTLRWLKPKVFIDKQGEVLKFPMVVRVGSTTIVRLIDWLSLSKFLSDGMYETFRANRFEESRKTGN